MRQLGVRFPALALAAVVLSAPEPGPASAGVAATCAGRPATLVGTDRQDRLVGTDGNDVIVGLGRDDVIRGRGGNDVICGGDGSDTLLGGAGDDEIHGGGSRIVRGDGEVVYLRDRLVPGAGDDVLVPGYDGGTSESRWDLLDFSDAPGGIVADVAADSVTGHGTDVVVGDHYAILGSRHDDTITGDDGDDQLYGWGGADVLRGGAGDDEIDDAEFYQLPTGAPEADVVDGGPGADYLSSADGADRILGRGGADLIGSWGGAAVRVDAGPGDDTIYGSLVLDPDQSWDAGLGRDEVSVTSGYAVEGVEVRPRTVIDLAAVTASVPAYDISFTFAGADRLSSYLPALTWYGTDGADAVDANPAFEPSTRRLVAHGRGGDDRIFGTLRADLLHGGRGHDRASGKDGADECISIEVQHSC